MKDIPETSEMKSGISIVDSFVKIGFYFKPRCDLVILIFLNTSRLNKFQQFSECTQL